MNKNKAIRLLATSWLIAPTILSTQSVFADEQSTQTTKSSIVAQKTTNSSTLTSSDLTDSSSTGTATTSSSMTESSTSSSTTESSTTESSTTDSSESPDGSTEETATRTVTIDPTLLGKIKLSTVATDTTEEKELTIDSSGVVRGLKEGTKIAYEITPSKDEKLVSFEVNGAQEVDYQQHTFTIGVIDMTLSAKFESTTETSNGGSTGSNGGSTGSSNGSNTGESTNQNSGNNGNPGNSSKPNGNSNNQSKPSTATNNDSVVSANNGGGSNSQSNNQRPSGSTNQSGIENPGTNSSDFVVKTPIESLLPANTTAVQQAIVREAYKYLGSPYVWGAKGPSTFDCSGLAYYVYMQATGHYIGGWTGEQQYAGTQIPVDQAQPGDLVFWGPSSGVTHHVGIYLGNGLYIHAPQPGDKVRITSIADYAPDFAVRVNIAGLPIASGSLANSSILDGLGDFNFSKNQTTDQFLKKIADSAQEIGQKDGIYASVMMAQAILESGSGNSLLSSEPNFNLFGIKGDYQGKSVSFNTLEQDESGSNYQIRASFRQYPSYKESLEDYAKLIKNGLSHNKDFYKPTWKSEAKTYKEATKYLEGRYATDKQYANKLNAIIKAYDLTKYDEPKKEEKSVVETSTKKESFVVPVSWNKNEMSLTNLDVSNFKRTAKKPDYFSTTKVLTIFEVLQRLSAREIPQTPVVQVKADTVPLLSILTIDNLLWIQSKFK
ncbi:MULTISPECIES: glucosaminidase domain-containing protein [Enterococcus]|uniref:glucosaminidase domain-containing protein n=1 Tax=Enterococcus TaxID=1350 RepID=UPI00110688C8|nr:MULTISPECIES: glucosaminidase domain-containing protein [Enterococcus]MDB1679429.1 NlpC/P60 family protein [Enterococcus durans]